MSRAFFNWKPPGLHMKNVGVRGQKPEVRRQRSEDRGGYQSCHSSFVIRHSSFVIRHSSFVIRHSSFVIHPLATVPTTCLNEPWIHSCKRPLTKPKKAWPPAASRSAPCWSVRGKSLDAAIISASSTAA